MTSAQDVTVTNLSTAERLSEALAEVFRTAEVGDVLTDDVFSRCHLGTTLSKKV
jgi:hypothetical protein